MKQTISIYDFRRAFERMDRKDQFSYEGLEALFNWYEEYEEDTGEEVELDVIALCCDFTEYENLEEFRREYVNGNGCQYETLEDVQECTTVIDIEGGGFIIQQF